MFSTSVLECRKSLDPIAAPRLSSASERLDENVTPRQSFGLVKRPVLQCLDKENLPLDQATDTSKGSRSGGSAVSKWLQMREADQLREKLAQEEKLRLQAEAALSDSRGLRKNLADVRARLEAKEQLVGDLEKELLRSKEGILHSKSKQLDSMKVELEKLASRTAANEVLLRERPSRSSSRSKKEPAMKRHADLHEEKILALKAVHAAVVRSILSGSSKKTDLDNARLKDDHVEEEHVEKDKAESEILQQQIQALKIENQQELAEVREQLRKVEAEAESLRAEQVKRCARIRSLEKQVERLQTDCDLLNSEIAEVDNRRGASFRSNDSSPDRVTLSKEVDDLKRELEHFRSLAEIRGREVEALQLVQRPSTGRSTSSRSRAGSEDVDRERTELLTQCRELSLSVNMFKNECESLKSENDSLRRSISSYEESLQRAEEENSLLGGHSNHRQKIQHLKEKNKEITHLRKECYQLHQKINKLQKLQIQRDRDGSVQSFMDALSPLASNNLLAPLASNKFWSHGWKRSSSKSGGASAAEAERQYQQMAHDLERLSENFQHFLSLVEWAIFSRKSGSPTATKDPAALVRLLEELRSVVATSSPAGQHGAMMVMGPLD